MTDSQQKKTDFPGVCPRCGERQVIYHPAVSRYCRRKPVPGKAEARERTLQEKGCKLCQNHDHLTEKLGLLASREEEIRYWAHILGYTLKREEGGWSLTPEMDSSIERRGREPIVVVNTPHTIRPFELAWPLDREKGIEDLARAKRKKELEALLATRSPACAQRVRQIVELMPEPSDFQTGPPQFHDVELLALPTEDEDDGGFVLEYTSRGRDLTFAVSATGGAFFVARELGGPPEPAPPGLRKAGVSQNKTGDTSLRVWFADGDWRRAGLVEGQEAPILPQEKDS